MSGQHRKVASRTGRTRAGVAAFLSVGLLATGGVLASANTGVSAEAESGSTSASANASATASTPTTTQSKTVKVRLAEKNNSGISGRATVTGSRVVATADGMTPGQGYESFVYGAGSTDSGNNPCILTGHRGAGPINTVGRWKVDKHGHGTLTGRIALPQLSPGTLSIREDDTGTQGATGPTPLEKLVACGHIGPRQTTVLGQAQDQLPAVKVPATSTALPTKVATPTVTSTPTVTTSR